MIKTVERKRDSGSCAGGWLGQGRGRGEDAEGGKAGRLPVAPAKKLFAVSNPCLERLRLAWGCECAHQGNSTTGELCFWGPAQPKERWKSEPMGWGKADCCGGDGASSSVQPKLKPYFPLRPPSSRPHLFLASWLPGCTEEQICGVDGFQASHPSSTMNPHQALIAHSAALPFPRESIGGRPGVCQGDSLDTPPNFALVPALFPRFLCNSGKKKATTNSSQRPRCWAPSLPVVWHGKRLGSPGKIIERSPLWLGRGYSARSA